MGNTYSPPPFSLFRQLPCLWLPTATHQKKKGGKKSCPQGECRHSNCLHQSNSTKHLSEVHVAALGFQRQNNLRVCVSGQKGDWISSSAGTQAEKKVKLNKAPDVQPLISFRGEDSNCAARIQASLFRAIR